MSFPLTDCLDPHDFAGRWKRARGAAIRHFLGEFMPVREEEAISKVASADREILLRRVFENSKRLGESAKWYFGVECEPADFKDLLCSSGVPCFHGAWRAMEEGYVLERPACPEQTTGSTFACEYYKQAVEGLVMGLSDGVRHIRHESPVSGAACKDLFVISQAAHLFFAPIPDRLLRPLEEAAQRLLHEQIRVALLGQAEGVIFYHWELLRKEGCRDYGREVLEALERSLAPDVAVVLRDVTPRSVLDPGSGSAKVHKKRNQKWNQIVN